MSLARQVASHLILSGRWFSNHRLSKCGYFASYPAPMSLVYKSRPKRKKARTMPLDEEWSSDLLKRISSIYKEIELSTLAPDQFSNPSQNNHIPWPPWTTSKLINPRITSRSGIWVDPSLRRFLSRRRATGSRRHSAGSPFTAPMGHFLVALVFSLVRQGSRAAVPDPYRRLQAALYCLRFMVMRSCRAPLPMRRISTIS